MSRLVPLAYQPLDVNGAPYPGALLYCYDTGTVVAHNTWSVEASIGGVGDLNTNPVVADAAGRFGDVFGDGSAYKLVLKTAAGVTIWTKDPVYGELTKYPVTTVAGTSNGATAAVSGTNSSTGAGGHMKNTGTGYGAILEADTTSPVKTSSRMVPQDSDSSSPLQGDSYVNAVDGKLAGYNGGSWVRYLAQLDVLAAIEQQTTAGAGSKSFSSVTIPANTLRVGSTIRVRANAFFSAGAGANIVFKAGTVAQEITATLATGAVNDMMSLDFDITFISVGAGATGIFCGRGLAIDGGVAANSVVNVEVIYNTTLPIVITTSFEQVGAGGATIDLVQRSVDIG